MPSLFVAALFSASLLAGFQQTPRQGTPNYDVPFHGKGQLCETPDGKLYYETEGSGPAVFIVAGGPGASHASFHPWFSRLAKDHTVVYFDNIGRGRSDRLKDRSKYTVQRDAEDIEALRAHLKLETISVIGHSYGGMPALAYALKYPQRVRRLVLSDTLHSNDGFQQNIDSANFQVKNQYPEVWEKLMQMRKKGVKSSADEYGDPYGNSLMDVYWYDMGKQSLMYRSGDPKDGFNGDVYLGMVGDDPEWKVAGPMRRFDPRKEMRWLQVPTLICVGRYDRIATPKVAYEMKKLLPQHSSKLVIFEKSGHRPWVEETEPYFKTLSEFLK